MEESTKKTLMITSIVVFIITCGWFLGVRIHQNTLHARAQAVDERVSQAQASYQRKYNAYRKSLINDQSSSRNKGLQSLSLQNGSVKLAKSVSKNFFKTLTTYDKTSYDAIGNKIKPLATDNVTGNKKIYDPGQSAYVKAVNLTSSYGGCHVWVESADQNSITYLCEVNNDVNYGDTPSKTKTTMYEIKYDKKQQKITDLNVVFVYHN